MSINKRTTSLRAYWLVLLAIALSACTKIATTPPSMLVKEEIAYLRLTDGYWQAWITDTQGQQHRQLTFDEVDKTRLSWSPDRQRLLCNRNDGHLLVVPIEEGRPTQLRLPMKGMLDAQWSPDGQWIAFSLQATQQQDNNDVWVIHNNGGGAQKLVSQPGASQLPSWHPDGNTLVYAQYRGREEHHLWRYDRKSGNREQLTVGDASNFDPIYNAKGELAFTSNRSGNYDIWLRQDSGSTQQVTKHSSYDAQPSWSPEGHALAFYSHRDNGRRIWVKNLSNGKALPVTPIGVKSRNPVWR